MGVILLPFVVLAMIIIVCFVVGIIEGDFSYLAIFLTGCVLTLVVILCTYPTPQEVAKRNNVDYTLVEAISRITPYSQEDIVATLSITGTDNLQEVFHLSEKEMVAIDVFIENGGRK